MIGPRHKYHASPTTVEGIKFPSKREAVYYQELCLRQRAGDIVGFFRQVPLDLPGGIKYVMDFFVFSVDGSCEAIEVKGYETKEWKLKHRLVKQCYPWLDLRVVK